MGVGNFKTLKKLPAVELVAFEINMTGKSRRELAAAAAALAEAAAFKLRRACIAIFVMAWWCL